jgi:hypothetical protein
LCLIRFASVWFDSISLSHLSLAVSLPISTLY